jgi:hypothetical protein
MPRTGGSLKDKQYNREKDNTERKQHKTQTDALYRDVRAELGFTPVTAFGRRVVEPPAS